ncbi:hypothetical protein HMPREF0433_00638 [Gemella sanguinis M325]|jgi:hypothetical protein|uniref:hypothetical protein n=1 Tax=Gemella sanguinis TaxID=84135 RepID=UPI000206D41D|nr:hypothetical protein [Gemella sanguinis]EGF88390.1 hypothetical protein HMPREF0433_00638 [Gemella sanguinis M325]
MVKNIISEELPKKYIDKHSLMLYLYDILVDILKKANKYKLSETKFKSSDKKIQDKDFIYEEIEQKESIELGAELMGRHILFSILSDMCHYLYESFSCIERGKVTVAYTLARKPLQDNLFYLCWLLDNPNDFYEKLKNEDPKEYDVSILKRNNEDVINMYSRILNVINKGNLLSFEPLSAEMLYELIYDRKSKSGLSQIFDKSIHLVTNNPNYKTEKKNLNFIFAGDEIWNEFWEYYYLKFPYILWFIVEVVIQNFERMLLIPKNLCKFNSLIRNLKFLIILNPDEKGDLEECLSTIVKDSLTITCDKCGNNILDNEFAIKEFREDYIYSCSNCGNLERIGQYFISDKLLKESVILEIDLDKDLYKLKSKYKRYESDK